MPLTPNQLIQGPVTPGGSALTVGATDIAASSIPKAKLAAFMANAKTGTGSVQAVAHGLGVVPSFVTVIFTGSTTAQAVVYGGHTSTNCVVTVTSGAVFDIIAFA
jgi:hypothetical protein